MRIAIVAPPWVAVPPPAYGGTEAVIDGLARGLVGAGHEVLLFTTGDSTCPVPRAWTLPSAVGTVNTGSATELHHVIRAYEAIGQWGADIVHDHTLVGPVYAERFAAPVVTTNHGPFDSELGLLYRTISARVAVIAISHHQASKASPDTRIAAVIHHGIDVDAVPVGTGGGGYAVFLGRMSPDKGADIAARIARRAGIPLKIAAKLAEPAEYEYFRTSVEPLLGSGIEFLGQIGGRAKYDLLGEACCLLNPLRWAEPFGMVMIEALACGTPVVATPMGSVPELITDGITGFVCADETEMASAVLRAGELDRPTSRRTAGDRYTLEQMAQHHVALFNDIVREHEPLRVA
jgi:glycosyltransferase involved in cell wall biosynthesis